MANFFKYLPENILSKKIEKGSFPFSQYLFWDAAIEKIDTEKHKIRMTTISLYVVLLVQSSSFLHNPEILPNPGSEI